MLVVELDEELLGLGRERHGHWRRFPVGVVLLVLVSLGFLVHAFFGVNERLQDLLGDREEVPDSGEEKPEGEQWAIAFDRVGFRHAGSERDILKDVSFSAEPGEVVAIAGRNGAGKSTILDLLLRFYDPVAGKLVVEGVDLRRWDLTHWRESIGVMSQDVFLFQGTILENIAYGRPDATPEEVEAAAAAAGVDRLAGKMPDGLGTRRPRERQRNQQARPLPRSP